MKQYILDFLKAMWKPFVVAIIAVAGTMYGMKEHLYIFMGICSVILSMVMCLWCPWIEEGFKMAHSSSKLEALAFSALESMLYAYPIFLCGMGFRMFILLRLPMMILHAASGECYYHHPTKRMKVFWYINHSSWNIASSVIPAWLYTGTQVSNIRPTGLTICLMLFWGTSLMFKLIRKKDVVVVK